MLEMDPIALQFCRTYDVISSFLFMIILFFNSSDINFSSSNSTERALIGLIAGRLAEFPHRDKSKIIRRKVNLKNDIK